ncbi:hypothetical protein L1887_45567 [Cichorium endivia]|nr:hypothetical protein L1887_45567 [Cichorium endivia]
MRGAVVVSAPLSGIRVTKGEDKLTEYRFNTGTARHFFCSVCGIYTFHQRRSNPNEYGVNVACFENVSPFDFPEVKVMDGVNHPMDGDSGPGYSGKWLSDTGETMLCVEKDDPREAPESGDKKPQPVKK